MATRVKCKQGKQKSNFHTVFGILPMFTLLLFLCAGLLSSEGSYGVIALQPRKPN